MADKHRKADQDVARIASRQHGVITTTQLLAIGLSRDAIATRAATSRLHRVHRGVYRVGHTARSVEADYLGAVLAGAPNAFLAGRAAGHNYRVLKGRPSPPEILVAKEKRHPNIIIRRARIDPRDTTVYRAIPSLTIPATIVDLAAVLTLEELGEAVFKADALHRISPNAVAAAAHRRGQVKGIANLRRIYEGDEPIILSRMERLFHDFLLTNGFPLPVTNRRAGAHYVDCRFAEYRVTVELDSYRFHRTRAAWEEDARRYREARARGDEFRRYTWADVAEDQSFMLAELAALLRA